MVFDLGNKESFINTLIMVLKSHGVRKQSMYDLVNTYSNYYDELSLKGYSYIEIINELKTPVVIYQNHQHQLRFYPKIENIITLTFPLISILLFLVLYFGAKTPLISSSYSLFLIPIFGSVIFLKDKIKTISLVFLSTLFIYIVLGNLYSYWDFLWTIFFLVPITIAIIFSRDDELYYGLLFFIMMPILYLLSYFNIIGYEYTWQSVFIFLIVYFMLHGINKKRIFVLFTLVFSFIIYNLLLTKFSMGWSRAIYAYIFWFLSFVFSGEMYEIIKKANNNRIQLGVYIGSVTVYIVTSLIFSNWLIPLLIFFVIPLYYIFSKIDHNDL